MFELLGKVLAYEVRPYTGADGSPQQFKELAVRLADGKFIKLPVSKDAPDFAPFLDKDVKLVMEIFSFKDNVKVRVVGVGK